MVNLQDYSGLPLLLNTQDNTINSAGDIEIKNTERIKLDVLKPILLNKTLRYPTYIYTEFEDICLSKHRSYFKQNSLHHNILVIPTGLLGIEYTKTHIFAPDKDQNEITAIIDIVYGRGMVLIQKIKEKGQFEIETEVSFTGLFRVKRGDRVPVPQGYMYTFINAGNSALILSRLFEDDGKIDYRTIWREQGMSYYIIRKNARREIVRNPRYKKIPLIKRIKPESYAKKYKLTAQTPIYTQFVQNPDRFKSLLV
jgi:oxalate decarboxylase/phosphoglucose isomerase-like protein (cupin superfamily)